MDDSKKIPAGMIQPVKMNTFVDPDLERRRQIYKNVRKDIEKDEQMKKQETYTKKMTEMEEKVRQKDIDRKN